MFVVMFVCLAIAVFYMLLVVVFIWQLVRRVSDVLLDFCTMLWKYKNKTSVAGCLIDRRDLNYR